MTNLHSDNSSSDKEVAGVVVSEINQADTVWILICSAMVFLMIPAVGFFYGALAQRKNFLSLLITGLLSVAVVSVQWYFLGFSLCFSDSESQFIGNFKYSLLRNVDGNTSELASNIPINVFMLFQCFFAAITVFLAFGGGAERATIVSYSVFAFLWTTFVYDFVAYWSYSPNGWLKKIDPLDFAGGTTVHILSGFSAIAYALAIGPRKKVKNLKTLKPSSPANFFLGTALLWFGWIFFNGGCEYALNGRTVNAVVVTNLSASAGGITWMLVEMAFHRSRKISLIGFCSGCVAGLVGITPCAGFVTPSYSILIGLITAFCCFFCSKIKHLFSYQIDDACDVFGVHGCGGAIGCILVGFFATNDVASMAGGKNIKGGWIDQHYFQMVPQLISIIVSIPWSFTITYLLVKGLNYVPFLKLKLNSDEQEKGADAVEIGEAHDIAELEMQQKLALVYEA